MQPIGCIIRQPFGCQLGRGLDEIFKALADGTRRELLDRLFAEPGQTLSALCRDTGMRRQSVSKHLRVLEEAGLVASHRQGREKIHYLNPLPIAEISSRWLDKYSRERSRAVLNLKQALEERAGEQTHAGDSNRDEP